MMPRWPAASGLLLAALALLQSAPAGDLVLTGRMHHLRLGAAREWADFPADAEGPSLVLTFEAPANGTTERALRLRHRDVKAAWRVQVNGRDIGRIPPDEADTVTYLAVPPGTLADGSNTLRIDGSGAAPDDVLFGEIGLIGRPKADVLTEATVDVAVHEDPGGRAIPSRITVTDERGTLVSLGNETDGSHAARPGVVYSRTGASLKLPAGRYVIYAGRGFEYSVDRVTVDVARGQVLARRLAIPRQVETTGWAAKDTHVHTATFAKHGDATIDERMLTLAGEGIELPVSTEHNTRVDFEARARAMDVRSYFTPILGTEVTTPALGHFNVFPMPAAGREIDQRSPDWTRLGESIAAGADRPMIVLNHGFDEHGGYRPLGSAPQEGVDGAFDHRSLPANAMEILNSGAVMSDALALTRAWMDLLNRGLRLTPVGSSDSHDVTRYIVGQGRTYVRCDDRDPGAIDPVRVVESMRRGQVMVSYGLLTEIDVDGRGPGELVTSRGELAVRIRVKGPAWTRADDVALYVNGTRVRHEAIPADNLRPRGPRGTADPGVLGVKWEGTWRLPAPGRDVHLVAVATGPGITAAYWPTAKPYQPTSPEFTPYVLGVSGAVFVTGSQESGSPLARTRYRPSGSPKALGP